LFCVAAAALGASSASAAVFYNNYDPFGGSDPNNAWLISAADSSFPKLRSPAMAFAAASSGSVNQIDITLENALGSGPSGVTVSLWTDVDDGLGTELGSWDVTALPPSSFIYAPSVTIPVSGVTLIGGDTYFLQAQADDGVAAAWELNITGATTEILFKGVDGGIDTAGAFDVLGTFSGTPEPASWALSLFGLGLIGGALRSRRERRSALTPS
jgi:hypothetical protein